MFWFFFSEGKCLTCVWTEEEEEAVAVAIHCPIRRWHQGAMATSWNPIGQRGKLPWQAELRRQNLSLISLQAVSLWSYYFIPVCGFMFLSKILCQLQPRINFYIFFIFSLSKPSKHKKMNLYYISSSNIFFFFLKKDPLIQISYKRKNYPSKKIMNKNMEWNSWPKSTGWNRLHLHVHKLLHRKMTRLPLLTFSPFISTIYKLYTSFTYHLSITPTLT